MPALRHEEVAEMDNRYTCKTISAISLQDKDFLVLVITHTLVIANKTMSGLTFLDVKAPEVKPIIIY